MRATRKGPLPRPDLVGLPTAAMARAHLEVDLGPNGDAAGAVGDLGAVEEQLSTLVGADRPPALVLVEGGDRAVHAPCSVDDLRDRELDDVAGAVVLQGRNERVDLRFG